MGTRWCQMGTRADLKRCQMGTRGGVKWVHKEKQLQLKKS